MCGFIGAISKNDIDDSKIQEADKFLECRGPDDHKWMGKKLDEEIFSTKENIKRYNKGEITEYY